MALIEITAFRLATGTGEAEFLAADEEARTGFLYQQPGITRATTARGDDGWVTVVLWHSAAHAEEAAAAGAGHPAVRRVMELVEPGSIDRRRYSTFD
jgi:hypothetical protein